MDTLGRSVVRRPGGDSRRCLRLARPAADTRRQHRRHCWSASHVAPRTSCSTPSQRADQTAPHAPHLLCRSTARCHQRLTLATTTNDYRQRLGLHTRAGPRIVRACPPRPSTPAPIFRASRRGPRAPGASRDVLPRVYSPARRASRLCGLLRGASTANSARDPHHVLSRVFPGHLPRTRRLRVLGRPQWRLYCHGLPVELEGREHLVNASGEHRATASPSFNPRCRESVFAFPREWTPAD